MTGAIAANLHEGSRSEYLAQYLFASFGTAAAIPHQEDSGVDLSCTLTERIGQRAWPRAYFAVQVKSTMDSWLFDREESIRWLVEHPLPLFLCIVDKPSARIRLYHTSPRFYIWSLPPLPQRLELIPTTDSVGKCTQWEGGTTFSLSAPILDASVQDFLNNAFHRNAWDVLHFWISVEQKNLQRIQTGLHTFTMPYEYYTNSTIVPSWATHEITEAESIEPALPQLEESLAWISSQLYRKSRQSLKSPSWPSNDILGPTLCAMLLRHFFKDNYHGGLQDVFLQQAINDLVSASTRYRYAGVDELNDMIKHKLTSREIPNEGAGGDRAY
jgi:hypothetical protein